MVLAREVDERLARLALHVGGIDDGEPPAPEPLFGYVAKRVEGVRGRRLVALIVGDETTEGIRGEHLGRLEVAPGEGRLARAGDSDEHDEREVRDDQAHRSKIAIWVGGPWVGSGSPMP